MNIKTFKKTGNTMRRILNLPQGHFLLGALIALSSIGLVSCAEPEPSILINAHVFRTGAEISDPDETGICEKPDFSECVSTSFDDEAILATRLFADVAQRDLVTGNAIVPQVAINMKNQLLNTENLAQLGEDSNLRIDTNSIQLEVLVATFSPTGPLKNIGDGGRVEIPLGTLLRSEGELHLGSKLALHNDADALVETVQTIAGENGGSVVTSVELQYFGKTLGGNEVESNVLKMPIELCYGCRIIATNCEPFTAVTPICVP